MTNKHFDGEARDRLIVWIRRRMEEFGISYDDLATAINADQAHRPVYQDAKGNQWNGSGDMPDWLKAAKHAGVDPEFFRVDSTASAASHDDREAPAFFFSR
ncbi:H-NS family nucleoid-associated regulatory protein [Paraburkholderia sp.]|uniref:H-NS family nucleoid-associated regulatory protein n=1 Tax=Paraburkholderia sp. TaxID=1926495 RepID=UPI00239E7CF0|nr:H-NS family nucleoid-associated regulatory protein [Paraburkholderia sp.]MDE1179117.1 H-NS family nucleoid-associated regulatory protein [Paraburkholderia sp.]